MGRVVVLCAADLSLIPGNIYGAPILQGMIPE